jgi:hypothetical protein
MSMTGDWTPIAQGNGGSTNSRIGVWSHVYDGVTSPDTTITHASGGGTTIATIVAFRGCNAASPVDTVGSIGSGTDATFELPGITPTAEGCMLLACTGAADDNGRSIPSAPTFTLTANRASSLGTPDGSICIHYLLHTTGATGTVVINQSASDSWAAVLVALAPIPSATGQPARKRMGGVAHAYGGYDPKVGIMRWRHQQSGLILPNRTIIQPESRLAS